MRGLFAAFALIAVPVSAQMSPPVPPANLPDNCASAEHHQFDFWIGDWEVFSTANAQEKRGASLVEPVYNGCGLRENWMPFTMATGGSLNSYDPVARRWRQTWMDSGNSWVEFEGGLVDGKMVLTGLWRGINGPGKDGLIRMTYSREAGGAVRQLGELSTDGGKTWAPNFDLTYRPQRKH